MSATDGLWLRPRKQPVTVDLERFRDYAGFFESFEQYGIALPRRVEVRWIPLKPHLHIFSDELDEAPDFIEWVEGYMQRGGDVPPLLVRGDELFDGRHRAWAAWNIGLRRAPAVDIAPYDRRAPAR